MILFNLSGHGHFDLSANYAFNSGKLENYDYPNEAITTIQNHLPVLI